MRESTAAYINNINKAAEAMLALMTKSSCDPADSAGAECADLTASGTEVVMTGSASATAGPAGVTVGSTGATAGSADAPTGAYATGVLFTGPTATHASHCVLRRQ